MMAIAVAAARLLRSNLATNLTGYLGRGGRSVLGWLSELHTADIPTDSPRQLRSVNRFDDLL